MKTLRNLDHVEKADGLPEFERILCSRVTELSHTVKHAEKTLQTLKTDLKSEENNNMHLCYEGDLIPQMN